MSNPTGNVSLSFQQGTNAQPLLTITVSDAAFVFTDGVSIQGTFSCSALQITSNEIALSNSAASPLACNMVIPIQVSGAAPEITVTGFQGPGGLPPGQTGATASWPGGPIQGANVAAGTPVLLTPFHK